MKMEKKGIQPIRIFTRDIRMNERHTPHPFSFCVTGCKLDICIYSGNSAHTLAIPRNPSARKSYLAIYNNQYILKWNNQISVSPQPTLQPVRCPPSAGLDGYFVKFFFFSGQHIRIVVKLFILYSVQGRFVRR